MTSKKTKAAVTPLDKKKKQILAILFACGEPLEAARIAEAMEIDRKTAQRLVLDVSDYLDQTDSPFQIIRLEDRFQLCTRTEYAPVIKAALDTKRNVPLSQAAMEVLAIVGYNQPVTRGFVEQVRGVDSSGVVASLVEKGLIEEAGRLDLPGRPISYRTTDHFLRTFGLSSLAELPPVESQIDSETLEEQEEPLEGQLGFEDEEVMVLEGGAE